MILKVLLTVTFENDIMSVAVDSLDGQFVSASVQALWPINNHIFWRNDCFDKNIYCNIYCFFAG